MREQIKVCANVDRSKSWMECWNVLNIGHEKSQKMAGFSEIVFLLTPKFKITGLPVIWQNNTGFTGSGDLCTKSYNPITFYKINMFANFADTIRVQITVFLDAHH